MKKVNKDIRVNTGPQNSNPERKRDIHSLSGQETDSSTLRYEFNISVKRNHSAKIKKVNETELVSPLNSTCGGRKCNDSQKFKVVKLKPKLTSRKPDPFKDSEKDSSSYKLKEDVLTPVTKERIETLIKKSFESEKAKQLEKMEKNLKSKNLSRMKQTLETDFGSKYEERITESTNNNVHKETKSAFIENVTKDCSMPVECNNVSNCRLIIKSDRESTDDSFLTSSLEERENSDKLNNEFKNNVYKVDITELEKNKDYLSKQGNKSMTIYKSHQFPVEHLQEDIKERNLKITGQSKCQLLKETCPDMMTNEISERVLQVVSSKVSTAKEFNEFSIIKNSTKKYIENSRQNQKEKECIKQIDKELKNKLKKEKIESVSEIIIGNINDAEKKTSIITNKRKYETVLNEIGEHSYLPATKSCKQYGEKVLENSFGNTMFGKQIPFPEVVLDKVNISELKMGSKDGSPTTKNISTLDSVIDVKEKTENLKLHSAKWKSESSEVSGQTNCSDLLKGEPYVMLKQAESSRIYTEPQKQDTRYQLRILNRSKNNDMQERKLKSEIKVDTNALEIWYQEQTKGDKLNATEFVGKDINFLSGVKFLGNKLADLYNGGVVDKEIDNHEMKNKISLEKFEEADADADHFVTDSNNESPESGTQSTIIPLEEILFLKEAIKETSSKVSETMSIDLYDKVEKVGVLVPSSTNGHAPMDSKQPKDNETFNRDTCYKSLNILDKYLPLNSTVDVREKNVSDENIPNRNSLVNLVPLPIRIGPLAVEVFQGGLLYSCYVCGCIFACKSHILFTIHIEKAHKLVHWDGICKNCDNLHLVQPLGLYKVSDALHHLLKYHLGKSQNDSLISTWSENRTRTVLENEMQSPITLENKTESISKNTSIYCLGKSQNEASDSTLSENRTRTVLENEMQYPVGIILVNRTECILGKISTEEKEKSDTIVETVEPCRKSILLRKKLSDTPPMQLAEKSQHYSDIASILLQTETSKRLKKVSRVIKLNGKTLED